MSAQNDISRVMSRWGSLGGKARAARLSSTRRTEIAREAVGVRWRRKRLGAARRTDLHAAKERASLRYHQAVAEKILRDPEPILSRARARLERWRSEGRMHPAYAAEWTRTLQRSPREIAHLLSRDSDASQALRQNSLFPCELEDGAWEKFLRDEMSGAGGKPDAPE